MIPLTKEEKDRHSKPKIWHNIKTSLVLMIAIKSIIKLEIIVILLRNIEVLLMSFAA